MRAFAYEAVTQQQWDQLKALLEEGQFRETAAAKVGISPRTLRSWYVKGVAGDKQFEPLVELIEAAEAHAEIESVRRIRNAYGVYEKQTMCWQSEAWLLQRRGAKRWGLGIIKARLDKESVEELLEKARKTIDKKMRGEE